MDTIDREVVEDESGDHRLRLVFVPSGEGEGYGFLKLCWEEKREGDWVKREEIDRTSLRERLSENAWIAEIHSFSPDSGIATLRFGSAGPRDSKGRIWALYTWREWDLARNREHRFVMVCDDPFSPFQDDRGERNRKRFDGEGGERE